MRKLLPTIAAALALASPALGADMALKAPKQIAYPYTGSGCYFGVLTEGGVATADTSSTFAGGLVSGSLTASGAGVGGAVGCIRGDATGTNWIALQGQVTWQNITGSDGQSSIGSRWAAEQDFKIGGFAALLNWLPNLGVNFPALPPLPTAPPGFIADVTTSHPYVMVGLREQDLSLAVGDAFGRRVSVSPLIGAGVLNQLQDSKGAPSGAVMDVFAKVVFDYRSFTVNNTGFPPTISGTATSGKTYLAGVGIYY